MTFLKMSDLDLADRRVLIREDLNVPVEDGRVTGDERIRAALPTIRQALEAGARVMVMSHLGRPKEGEPDPAASLAPVAERLGELLGRPVRLVPDWLDGVDVDAGEVALLENVRFCVGEKADDKALAQRMAALCDIFVMDAFATAHRAQASTHGVARLAPTACAGPLLVREVESLRAALESPRRPLLAIVGGAKVSTKLTVLERQRRKVDQLIVGGGIANTFIAAAGYAVGRSLHEPELIDEAARIMRAAADAGAQIPLPEDVVVAPAVSADVTARVAAVDDVGSNEMILDVGPQTRERYGRLARAAGTVVWNGPVGVFEIEQFGAGTRALAEAIAASEAFSIAGGGDTVAAIERYGVADRISYISTGGGAFMEFLEGKTLPAIAALEERAAGA